MSKILRIKIKIKTTQNINLLCAANKQWDVQKFMSKIRKLYKQVIKQQNFQIINNKDTTIKKNKNKNKVGIIVKLLKFKDCILVRKQKIGDLLMDGDQVQCMIEHVEKQYLNEQKDQNQGQDNEYAKTGKKKKTGKYKNKRQRKQDKRLNKIKQKQGQQGEKVQAQGQEDKLNSQNRVKSNKKCTKLQQKQQQKEEQNRQQTQQKLKKPRKPKISKSKTINPNEQHNQIQAKQQQIVNKINNSPQNKQQQPNPSYKIAAQSKIDLQKKQSYKQKLQRMKDIIFQELINEERNMMQVSEEYHVQAKEYKLQQRQRQKQRQELEINKQ